MLTKRAMIRISSRMMRKLNIDATMDQIMEITEASRYPIFSWPVTARVDSRFEATTRSPMESTGLKSMLPMRRKRIPRK